MKWKLDRIISLATLVASCAAICLVLKRPAPVAQPPAPAAAAAAAHADSSSQRAAQPVPPAQSNGSFETPASAAGQTPQSQSQSQVPGPVAAQGGAAVSAAPKGDTNISSDAISAMIAKTLGAGAGGLSPDSNVGSGEPNIKDQQVTMDGDVVHGRFLTEIAGKDVWVTISGHMGEKDGYATFDPTEFKVGDTEVPVSMVNPLLQQKLAEQRDRLKVPNAPQ
jgi:hypothetical protein